MSIYQLVTHLGTFGIDFGGNSVVLALNDGKNNPVIIKNENNDVSFPYNSVFIIVVYALSGLKIFLSILHQQYHMYTLIQFMLVCPFMFIIYK